VVVEAPVTGWLKAEDVPVAKLLSPPKTATIRRVPEVV
jgi:hypothetical protein